MCIRDRWTIGDAHQATVRYMIAACVNSIYNEVFVQTVKRPLHKSMGKILALLLQAYLKFFRVSFMRSG